MTILITENIAEGMWVPTNDGTGLWISQGRGSFVDFYLFDGGLSPKGNIVLDRIQGAWSVRFVWGEHGYGAAMYEIAMNWVRPLFLTTDKEVFDNDKSYAVWRKYYGRADVQKIPTEKGDKYFRQYENPEKTTVLNQKYKLKNSTMNVNKLLKNGAEILRENRVGSPDRYLWERFLEVTEI